MIACWSRRTEHSKASVFHLASLPFDTCQTHLVVVDDLHDNRQLSSKFTLVDEDNTADLDKTLE
jgi:hypothetical protein